MSENKVSKKISAVFLLATPFWSSEEDWKQGLRLNSDFPKKLSKEIPLFFYQAHDDKEVWFDQFKSYKYLLPRANFHEFESGGHQFNGNINVITNDIKNLPETE